ncbi:MAG: hypothetical protein ACM3N0_02190 [Chloroflexota bacterium]
MEGRLLDANAISPFLRTGGGTLVITDDLEALESARGGADEGG